MDNQITDKGWAAMRKLLDSEMPEKKRRPFGWWWLALLLPIACYGTWLKLNTVGEQPKQERQQKPTPTHTLAETAQQEATSLPLIPAQSASTGQSGHPENELSKPAQHVVSKIAGQEIQGEILTEAVIENGNLAESAVPHADASVAGEASANQVFIPLDWVLIPTKSIDFESNNAPNLPLHEHVSELKPIKPHTAQKWSFASLTAISSERFNAINGFSTGLNIDRRIGRKWGIRSGALFTILIPEEKYRPIASVGSDAYTSNVGTEVIVVDQLTGQELLTPSGAFSYGDSLASNVLIPVNSFQRLDIPIAAFWQPVKNVKIIGGVSLTRTLSTKADRQNYSGDYILKLANSRAEESASRLSSNEFNNWSADVTLGTSLQLGDIFEVGLSAKMPMSNFKSFHRSPHGAFSDWIIDAKPRRLMYSLHAALFF